MQKRKALVSQSFPTNNKQQTKKPHTPVTTGWNNPLSEGNFFTF